MKRLIELYISGNRCWNGTITKTCLFKYTENFTTKNEVLDKKNLIFFIFLLKTYTVGTRWNRLTEAILTSTQNLCFGQKYEKNNVYSCKPQFYYIKVGFKRVKII